MVKRLLYPTELIQQFLPFVVLNYLTEYIFKARFHGEI